MWNSDRPHTRVIHQSNIMFKKLILTAILCFAPTQAFAGWVPVAQLPDGRVFSINPGDIVVQGNNRMFWVNLDYQSGNVAASRTLMAANCGTNQYTYLWFIAGDRSGQIIANEKVSVPIATAEAGSGNMALINIACTGGGISDPQLEALTRSRQTNAEAINRAMESAAKMFR